MHVFSINKLQNDIDFDGSNSELKSAAINLLTAINDWPFQNTNNIEDFLKEISEELGSPLTINRFIEYSRTLSVEKDAWKMESFASIIEVFNYNKTKTLNDITKDIFEFYEKKSSVSTQTKRFNSISLCHFVSPHSFHISPFC